MNFTIYKRKDGRFEARIKLEKTLKGTYKYKYIRIGECKIKCISLILTHFILHSHLYNKKSKNSNKNLSSITIYNIMIVLRIIFNFADKKLSLLNPTKNIKIFKDRQIKDFLSDKYWQIIYSSLKTDKSSTALAISIALYMGLRIGEICALQVSDINFNNNTLSIEKSVQRINLAEKEQKTKLIVSTPKTKTSRRLIPIPYILIKPLKNYSKSLSNNDFLFGIDGRILDPRTLQYRFKKISTKI